MSETQKQIPIQPVEKPVICSPYTEPDYHWDYVKQTGQAVKTKGRRRAGYWYKTEQFGTKEKTLFSELEAEENFDDLPLINLVREDVRRWREADYRGATNVTKELLKWWASPERSRRLFFCQCEAVETMIYLAELRIPGRTSKTGFRKFALSDENLQRLLKGERPKPEGEVELDRFDGNTVKVNPFQNLATATFYPTLVDLPWDSDLQPLQRMGCKMATGSGKTVVMSMLIAWAFCNRAVNPNSIEFPNAVLVCCPNLTVKERLQVLRPDNPDNYYATFDLVPVNLRPHLHRGKVLVENWHKFSPESEHKEGDKSYAVVNKGPETPETLARRVLGDLYDRLPIMVLNDEGHHCWRPAPPDKQVEEVDTARNYREKCDFYISKCCQHLYRTKLSRQLAIQQIRERSSAFSKKDELVSKSIDDAEKDIYSALVQVVAKTHFLLLKVEFEFFLSQTVHYIWDCFYEDLVLRKNKLLKKEYRLADFAMAIARNQGKSYVISKLVPRHGLQSLCSALEHATGINVANVLNKHQSWYWSQVHSAFEVRHLVEHTNGKVDSDFLTTVAVSPLWKHSSWCDLELVEGEKITIRECDFEKTCEAMLGATPIIGESLKEFATTT